MRRLAVALLLALVMGPDARAAVLFKDNFTGGKSGKWVQTNDGATPGSFSVKSGTYVLMSRDPATVLPRALVRSIDARDYFVQADVRVRPVSEGLASASIVSYYTDSRHFYEFAVDLQSHFFSLRKVDKSGSALLAEGAIPGQPRALFRLGLYFRQGDLRAFIDGIMVAQEFDQRPLPAGAFGLSAQGAQADFDNVLVKASNPQDFFYAVQAQVTSASGIAGFNGIHIAAVSDTGKPAAGIVVYRIRRDGLSYFVLSDPAGHLAPRSGFLSEFQQTGKNDYAVTLTPAGAAARSHTYASYEVDWIFDFVHKSARLAPDHVSVELKTTRKLYLRDGEFVNPGIGRLTDAALGSSGAQAEINQLVFGSWEEFGNYTRFPSLSARLSAGDEQVSKAAAQSKVPQNSRFALYTLLLSANGSSVSISWFVQEDSRAFLLVDSASFPASISQGKSYTVPVRVLNTGENAGAFSLSVVLSTNSFPGATDPVLGHKNFDGLAANSNTTSDIEIEVPASIPAGHYFISTFLQTPSTRDKLLRVHNGNFVRTVVLGNEPAPGRIAFSLNWSGPADLDIHVTDPFGETIYYFNPVSDSGGSLQKDRECNEPSSQSEVISYPDGNAYSGKYIVSVHYFRQCGDAHDVTYTLTVDSDKGSQTFSGVVHPGDYVTAAEYVR